MLDGSRNCNLDLNWHPDSFDTLRQGDSPVPPYDWLSRPALPLCLDWQVVECWCCSSRRE
jgi:hypothetical protein